MRKMMMAMCGACLMAAAHADERTVEMRTVNADGLGESIGTVTVLTTPWGVLFTPDLSDLPPGLHGFHVHQNANCAPAKDEGEMAAAIAAGGHYDPQSTGRHEGPYGDGHLGDLPGLYVDAEGKAMHPVLAPRLKFSDLNGRALMIHAGGDNYSDRPIELGGGGSRIVCGAIKS
jgi:superoxide dismutase, Cu-Zn family